MITIRLRPTSSAPRAAVSEAPALASWTFVVRGPPQPKERARRGKGGRWYTPERTRAYEAAIRNMAMLSRSPRWAVDRQYAVTVTAHFADGRPRDVDNVLKAVLDGLAGVAFDNDRQVVETHAYRGGVDRADPRTIVSIVVVRYPAPCLRCDGTGRIVSLDMSSCDDVTCDACGAPGKLPKGRAKR